MGKFYSDKVEQAIQLIWFTWDSSMYPEGVALLEDSVQSGDADACYFLGRCYAWGDAQVKVNSNKALELFRQGISLGSSLCVLGAERMGSLPPDITDEMTKSLEEYFLDVKGVAEAGEPMAQYAIGLFYFWGDMLMDIQKLPLGAAFEDAKEENAATALEWFRRSANMGLDVAFQNIYYSLLDGKNGVKKDPQAALHYAEEVKNLGISYFYGRGVEQNRELAVRLFHESAEYGEQAEAWRFLGECYDKGLGVEENIKAAVSCYKKAIAGGCKRASEDLAQFKKPFLGKWERRS